MVIFFGFFSGILNLIFGIIVLYRSRNNIQKKFAYLSFLITLWIFFNLIYYLFLSYPFVNLSYTIGALLITAIFLWIVQFSQIHLKFFHKILLAFVTFGMMVVSLIPNKFILGDVFQTSFGYKVQAGPIFILYVIPAVILLAGSIIILIRKYINSAGLQRLQLAYVTLGFIVPITIIVIIDFIVPVFFGLYDIASLDVITSVIFVGFISYSILRYRFMDIRLVMRKGLVYFISLAVILFFYIYLLLFIQRYFIEQYNWSEQTLTIIAIAIVAVTIEPLRRLVINCIDKIFFSGQSTIDGDAEKLNVVLNSSLQFNQLISKVVAQFREMSAVEGVQFLLQNRETGNLENYQQDSESIVLSTTDYLFQRLNNRGEIIVSEEIPYIIDELKNGERKNMEIVGKKMKTLGAELALPIGERGELLGVFLFGKKVNKIAFTSNEVAYLEKMKNQLSGAIANALMYKQAVERIAGLKNS